MAELIVFPDVEDALRLALTALPLGTGTVVTCVTKPAPIPARLVHVTRTGGSQRDLVTDTAQMTIECYARTGSAAWNLAAQVRAHLSAAERDGRLGTLTVYDVTEYGAPYLDPDPVQPALFRYSATYAIAVRGAVA